MDELSRIPVTMCMTKAALATGTTSTLTTTGTTTFVIRGKFYTKAAITNLATPTTDWATGRAFVAILPNQGSVFMIGYDSGGNLRAIQGSVVPLDSGGAFTIAPIFGGLGPAGAGTTANDFCPIGYILVKAGATTVASGWLFGTGAWNATGIVTPTVVDVNSEPDRPQLT